jgi:hypothetical protein
LAGNGSAEEGNQGAHASGIAGFALESDGDPRGEGGVFVNAGEAIEVVDHDIEIAVVVEVAEGNPLGHFVGGEAPVVADILEGEVAPVAEGDVRRIESVEHGAEPQLFEFREALLVFQHLGAVGDIDVHHVAFVAGGENDVFVAVEIDVDQDRAPGPTGCLRLAVPPNLGISAVATIQTERVAGVLRAVVDGADFEEDRRNVSNAQLPAGVLLHHHVRDKNIHEPVTVEVADIDSHGEQAGVAQREPGDGAEPTVALIDPDPVGRLEVVGDVKVRGTVTVEIAEHGGEPPIVEILLERPALLIQERALGERYGREPKAAFIAEQQIGFPIFDDPPIIGQSETPDEIGLGGWPAVDELNHHFATDLAALKLCLRMVTQGFRTIIRQVEIQISVPVDIGECRGGSGPGGVQGQGARDPSEASVTVIGEDVSALTDAVHDEIEVSVAIEVGERGTGGAHPLARHAGRGGHILEPPAAQVAVEHVGIIDAAKVNVAKPVSIDVTQSHAGPVQVDLVGQISVQGECIGELNAGAGGGQKPEPGLTLRVDGERNRLERSRRFGSVRHGHPAKPQEQDDPTNLHARAETGTSIGLASRRGRPGGRPHTRRLPEVTMPRKLDEIPPIRNPKRVFSPTGEGILGTSPGRGGGISVGWRRETGIESTLIQL